MGGIALDPAFFLIAHPRHRFQTIGWSQVYLKSLSSPSPLPPPAQVAIISHLDDLFLTGLSAATLVFPLSALHIATSMILKHK